MADEHVTDDGDTKKYWTQIPNIVFELGLKPFELVLYAHLKRAAGSNSNGKCTKSTPTLARETGMGAGTVSRAKTALQARRPDLHGKPLIRTRETINPRGGKKRHEIIITDIWKENMARFASSSMEIEADAVQVPVRNDQVPEPISPVEIKKNLLEEEPSEEKPLHISATFKLPRRPGSDDDLNDKSPKFHYSALSDPAIFGYDIIATMSEMFPSLSIRGDSGLYVQWSGKRILSHGIGGRPRAKSTLREYALDFELYLRKCNTNGNGNGRFQKTSSGTTSEQSNGARRGGSEELEALGIRPKRIVGV